jgi:hypothetical protein
MLNGLPRQEDEMGWERGTYENRDVYGALVGKPEGQRSYAIRTRGWENNIKTCYINRMGQRGLKYCG